MMAEPADVKALSKLFDGEIKKNQIRLEGKCAGCGCDVKISITRTSGGFGLMGGMVFEMEDGRLLCKCGQCHKKGEPIRNASAEHILRSV